MTTYDYRIRDEFDNGEFFTSATIDLIEDGVVVSTEKFTASSEFPNDGTATVQAASYGNAWVDTRSTTLEEAFAPFGPEWQREQEERW